MSGGAQHGSCRQWRSPPHPIPPTWQCRAVTLASEKDEERMSLRLVPAVSDTPSSRVRAWPCSHDDAAHVHKWHASMTLAVSAAIAARV